MSATIYCRQCKHCGTAPHDDHPAKRLCGAVAQRRESHFAERGRTPDAYWTAPEEWTYVNSAQAKYCASFVLEAK